MNEPFFDLSTRQDVNAVAAYFIDVMTSPHEPEKTFQKVDEITGDLVPVTLRPGDLVASITNDSVPVMAPDIPTNGGPSGTNRKRYDSYPVEVTLPPSGTDRVEVVQLTIDNIERTYVDLLRNLEFPLKLNVGVGWVLPKDDTRAEGVCDYLVHRFAGIDMIDPNISKEVIAAQLTVDNILWRKYPNNHETYEHENFPGLWGNDPDDQ